ncbi:hypothetical protein D3C87_1466610 [compost metagenome]
MPGRVALGRIASFFNNLFPVGILFQLGVGIDLVEGDREIFVFGRNVPGRIHIVDRFRDHGQEFARAGEVVPAIAFREKFPCALL